MGDDINIKKVFCLSCDNSFEVDLDKVNEEYIQCPICGHISVNKLNELKRK